MVCDRTSFCVECSGGHVGHSGFGDRLPRIFDVELSGPALLTGGSFGLEASIVPVMISLMIAIPMLIRAQRKGHIHSRK